MREDFRTICPNCFSDKMKGDVCGACGYDLKNAKSNTMALPEFTMLNSRYLVGRIIGSGGFGITYKAYDIMSNKIRAVKEYVPLGIVNRREDGVTMTEVTDDKHRDFVHGKKRFYEEAKALYACSEIPDVVEIVDYFQANNTVYFVMEYIRGITLKKYMTAKEGKLSLDVALKIVYDVGNVLEQVHQMVGIFHRDISPENIMITSEGQTKIIDFGNAKDIGKSKLSIILKPGFAPPEQYSSQTKQGRYTDVYALAGTFYYMVTGKMIPVAPERLAGSDYVKLKDMHVGASEDISDAVDKALELNCQKRYQTVGEFLNALCPTIIAQPDEGKEYPPGSITKEVNTVSAGAGAYLEIVDGIAGISVGTSWRLKNDTQVSVGRRGNKAEIIIEGDANDERYYEISRQHFFIEYNSRNEQFYIEDTSENGTYVDGYELRRYKKYILPANSVIVLGVDVCKIKLGVSYE